MTISSSSEPNLEDSLSSLIMQGLACGTILYVAFFEILERERSKSTVGLIQWTLLVFGFCAIMGLQLLGKNYVNQQSELSVIDTLFRQLLIRISKWTIPNQTSLFKNRDRKL